MWWKKPPCCLIGTYNHKETPLLHIPVLAFILALLRVSAFILPHVSFCADGSNNSLSCTYRMQESVSAKINYHPAVDFWYVCVYVCFSHKAESYYLGINGAWWNTRSAFTLTEIEIPFVAQTRWFFHSHVMRVIWSLSAYDDANVTWRSYWIKSENRKKQQKKNVLDMYEKDCMHDEICCRHCSNWKVLRNKVIDMGFFFVYKEHCVCNLKWFNTYGVDLLKKRDMHILLSISFI